MTAGFRVREQKFICGKDYATADTMQVDFFEITEQQHKASTRKKKELASSIAKEAYNLRKSGRYLELLVQRNFHKSDYSVTYTYDDEHRPDPADTKRVDKDFSAAMKKLYRMCDKKAFGTRSGSSCMNTRRMLTGCGWESTITMSLCSAFTV